MKLEVGMYVRTDTKIIKIDGNEYQFMKNQVLWYPKGISSFRFLNSINASHNIIDLIEVGDYVNGMKVKKIDGTYYGRKDVAVYVDCAKYNDDYELKFVMIYDDEIKEVLTKEQYEANCYKIRERNEEI